MVKRISSNNLDIFSKRSLYLALVRSHLGYPSEIWSPYLHKDMVTLERVQRRATKYILNDYNLRYTDRLMKLSLLPVSYWHEQKDLCTLHKVLNNAYDIKTSTYVSPKLVKSRTSSGLILRPHFSRTLSFNNSYFNRVTSSWNALPEPIRSAKTFLSCKTLVINYLTNTARSHFSVDNLYTWRSICSRCHNHVSLPRKSSVHCCF